jgi:hypothetical protein
VMRTWGVYEVLDYGAGKGRMPKGFYVIVEPKAR